MQQPDLSKDPTAIYVGLATTSMQAAQDQVRQLSIKRTRAIQRLLSQGYTITEMAKATGINRQTLYAAANKRAS